MPRNTDAVQMRQSSTTHTRDSRTSLRHLQNRRRSSAWQTWPLTVLNDQPCLQQFAHATRDAVDGPPDRLREFCSGVAKFRALVKLAINRSPACGQVDGGEGLFAVVSDHGLERDVVAKLVARLLLRGLLCRFLRLLLGLLLPTLAAQHLHLVGYDLGRVTILPSLVLPFARL